MNSEEWCWKLETVEPLPLAVCVLRAYKLFQHDYLCCSAQALQLFQAVLRVGKLCNSSLVPQQGKLYSSVPLALMWY